MNKRFSGILVAALAVAGVLGSSGKANAALVISFDNIAFDGGTVSDSGGGNFTGTNILFDTIRYTDTSNPGVVIGALQCGPTASLLNSCLLNFSTAADTFTVVAPTGLYDAGNDGSYAGFTGAQIVANGQTVLSGDFSTWDHEVGPQGEFAQFDGFGTDTKNAALLAFFGLPADTTFTFANTVIHINGNGQVVEADLSNIVNTPIPEPATMMLLGTGLLAAFRARRKLT